MAKIYIASMNLRGKWAAAPENSVKLNVTSAQYTASKDRRDFSPMTHHDGGYKGFHCFENYWQSGKVIEGIPHEKTVAWWKGEEKPHRRYPNSKGKKVLHAVYEGREPLGYIESRKQVYVPLYYKMIENRERIAYWHSQIKAGKTVVVYDFDGPHDTDGNPICVEVSRELLREKINDPKFPFGHGYVVASILAGIPINDFL